MWLPDCLRPPEISEYVQAVEVAADFDGEVPEGFKVTDLPMCKMMVFRGRGSRTRTSSRQSRRSGT
jgi:AraC family transcriptional regulator